MFTVDSAHGGGNWLARTDFVSEDVKSVWKDCGVYHEWGKLRAVLLHHPGEEIEGITDPSKVLWSETIEPTLAREQHNELSRFYRAAGVEVNYLYLEKHMPAKPNLYFVRDLFTMTPFGAVVSRPASYVRAGEEVIASHTLSRLQIPIVHSAYGSAYLEGPDILLVNSDLAFVGYGLRTNEKGADFAIGLLKEMGYGEVVKVQTTYGCGHLDGVVGILDRDLALLYPKRVSYVVYETLKRHGFRTFDLPDQREAEQGMAINLVPIEPGCVLMPAGNPHTRAMLQKAGCTCFEIDVSELMKGGGAVHCMTGVLKRDL